MERARRLRVRSTQPDLRGSRETLPGPTMWVRPATGWWGRMNAGESPRNQGRTVWAPLSASRRRSRGRRKTLQWSAGRRTPYVTGRTPQGVKMFTRASRRSTAAFSFVLETAFWEWTGAPIRNALDSAGFHPRSSAPTSPLPDEPTWLGRAVSPEAPGDECARPIRRRRIRSTI